MNAEITEAVARAIWNADQDPVYPNQQDRYALKMRMSWDEAMRAARAAIETLSANTVAPDDADAEWLRHVAYGAPEMKARFNRIAERIASKPDGLREALEEIEQWASAYPLERFAEPDVAGVTKVLTDAGMREQIDRLHASWARHIVLGIGNIARDALSLPQAKGDADA